MPETPDYAYVAFLDILGYRDLLERDTKEGTSIFRDRMTRAFRHFENINRAKHQYQIISDSIFFACADRAAAKEFLSHVRSIFAAFLAEGLLIRGGITFGPHFMNQSVTYSPALTKAYKLESTEAIFPRVMVDSNIMAMFDDLVDGGYVKASGENWFLAVATNENLDQLWELAKATAIADHEAIHKSENIRSKHKWLQDYLLECHTVASRPLKRPYLSTFDSHTAQIEASQRLQIEALAIVIAQVAQSRSR